MSTPSPAAAEVSLGVSAPRARTEGLCQNTESPHVCSTRGVPSPRLLAFAGWVRPRPSLASSPQRCETSGFILLGDGRPGLCFILKRSEQM